MDRITLCIMISKEGFTGNELHTSQAVYIHTPLLRIQVFGTVSIILFAEVIYEEFSGPIFKPFLSLFSVKPKKTVEAINQCLRAVKDWMKASFWRKGKMYI